MVIRIGLIGAGWVTAYHLDAYRSFGDRVQVVAIADPSEAARSARAGTYGIQHTYDDAARMLALEQLDAVDIASPRQCHVEHVRQAAFSGRAVFCQKPLAPSFAEAAALVEEVGARVPFMVHENWRFRPHYRQIKAWLDADRIGVPQQVTMSLLTSGLVPDAEGRLPALARQPMLKTLDQMLLKEILVHHIDTLRFLLGELSLMVARVGRQSDAVIGDDHAHLAMSTRDGAPVTLTGNLCAHGYPSEAFDRLEILGSKGRILLERDRLMLDGAAPAVLSLDLAENYRASYRGAIGHFLDGLASGNIIENRAADNLGTLRLVDEGYARGSTPIEVAVD